MADPITVIRVTRVGADAVGQVSALVARVDPDLVRELHAAETIRPYATRAAEDWREIVCLDNRLARAVIAGAVALGASPRVMASLKPEAFRVPPARAPIVTHLSPCHYRVAGGEGKSRLPVICPDIERMLAGLARRWAAWTGEEMPPVNHRAIGIDVRAFARATWPIRGGQRIDGFTGEVRLDCSRLPEQAAAVATLLRFGAFRGVGSHTTYGMGWIGVG